MLRLRQPRSAASKMIWATRPKATVAGLMDRGGCARLPDQKIVDKGKGGA